MPHKKKKKPKKKPVNINFEGNFAQAVKAAMLFKKKQ